MAKGKAYNKVLVPFKPSEPDNNSFQLSEKSSDDCVLLDDCGPSETSSQVQYRLSMEDKEISQGKILYEINNLLARVEFPQSSRFNSKCETNNAIRGA